MYIHIYYIEHEHYYNSSILLFKTLFCGLNAPVPISNTRMQYRLYWRLPRYPMDFHKQSVWPQGQKISPCYLIIWPDVSKPVEQCTMFSSQVTKIQTPCDNRFCNKFQSLLFCIATSRGSYWSIFLAIAYELQSWSLSDRPIVFVETWIPLWHIDVLEKSAYYGAIWVCQCVCMFLTHIDGSHTVVLAFLACLPSLLPLTFSSAGMVICGPFNLWWMFHLCPRYETDGVCSHSVGISQVGCRGFGQQPCTGWVVNKGLVFEMKTKSHCYVWQDLLSFTFSDGSEEQHCSLSKVW